VSIFYRQLENALSDAGASQSTMTIVLLEVMNYDRIVSEQGPEQAKELWVRLSEELKKLSEHRAEIYHYKEENQIAALFSGLDYDGASLFCLETLELMNSADWTIGEEKTPLEVAIGYASYAGKESSIDQLIDQAETLLDMQKS
jgi:GGDEF domain-containing protein